MVLFKIYYVSATDNWTDKEEAFFTQVQGAAYDAFSQKERDMTMDEWNVNGFMFTNQTEASAYFKRQVPASSVVVLYRNSSKDEFKAAFLKGVGNVKAWKNAFLSIFNGTVAESKGNDSDSDNDKGSGDKDGNGTGGGGNGNGNRPCTFVDTFLADMGLGDFRKYIYYAGAAFTGVNALSTPNKGGQAVFGAATLGLIYLAMNEPNRCGKNADNAENTDNSNKKKLKA